MPCFEWTLLSALSMGRCAHLDPCDKYQMLAGSCALPAYVHSIYNLLVAAAQALVLPLVGMRWHHEGALPLFGYPWWNWNQ